MVVISEDYIQKQRDTRYNGLVILTKRKYKNELDKKLARFPIDDIIGRERETAKSDRKLETYLAKKKVDYQKNAEKEIKKLQKENKAPKKEKEKRHNKLVQELMSLMQYYVRLRDTDQHGQGVCISCGSKIHGTKANGGHFLSRMYKSVCVRIENINMQCPGCNHAMGPGKYNNPELAKRLEENYRKNLVIKYGIEIVLDLEYQKERECRNPQSINLMNDYLKEEIVTYRKLIAEEEKKKVWRK